MKSAIMQPYIFPYLGYFQLVKAVDNFVFYDDVNFIKRGWINRNNLLVNGESKLFTIPLKKASQNKLINEIEISSDEKWKDQFLNTLHHNYKKAPFYEETMSLIKPILDRKHGAISELAIDSIVSISDYLEMETKFEVSSKKYSESKGTAKADRLIEISSKMACEEYVNPSGGKELYDKSYFSERGITLYFIENKLPEYKQFDNEFKPGLSIIDVLMFNPRESITKMLDLFKLI